MNETIAAPSLKKSVSRLGIGIFVMMLVHQLVVTLVSVLLGMYAPNFLSAPYGIWVANYVPLYLIAVPIYFLIARTAPTTDPGKEQIKMPFNTFLKWWFISMAALIAFNIVSNLINMGIGYLKGSEIANPLASVALSSGMLYNFIFGVLVAPIGEEFIFRYMFYKKLSGYGDKVYIFASSLCFAMMHGNLSQLLYAFVLGAIFAYIMARTRKIIYPIIMHIVINAYGMVVAPLAAASPILISALGMAVMAVVVFGVVLFFKTKRKGFILDAPVLEVSNTPIKDCVLNLGTILTLTIGIALCVFVIVLL